MEHLEEVMVSNSIASYKVKHAKTIRDILHELKLDNKYFAVLVNGQRKNLDESVLPDSTIVILPKIAGG